MFGAAVLSLAISRGHEIAGVCSPAFASDGIRPDRLRSSAELARVPWMEEGQLSAATLPIGVDLIIAAHSHRYIGRPTRLRARLGAVGYHPSLLPLHRGRDAVRWALHMGEKVTGGTVYWLADGVDDGDIAAQGHVLIRPGERAEDLWQRALFPIGLKLFDRVLGDLESGILVRVPQDHLLATWEPARDRQPIHRPELPQLGEIDGFNVVRRVV